MLTTNSRCRSEREGVARVGRLAVLARLPVGLRLRIH